MKCILASIFLSTLKGFGRQVGRENRARLIKNRFKNVSKKKSVFWRPRGERGQTEGTRPGVPPPYIEFLKVTEHRAQNPEHRAQSTELCRTPIARRRAEARKTSFSQTFLIRFISIKANTYIYIYIHISINSFFYTSSFFNFIPIFFSLFIYIYIYIFFFI